MATANKKLIVSLLAASVLFGAAGCSMSGISPPARGASRRSPGCLRPQHGSEAESASGGVGGVLYVSPLNPYQCDNTFNRLIGCLIYEGLFELTPELSGSRLCNMKRA